MRIGTSYFGSRAVRHVAGDMERLRLLGFTDVLHTFSEEDMEYYRDSVRDIAAESHARGLTVYMSPWSVANIFGGQALSKFVGYHPGECQVGSDGKTYPAACLNSEKLFELMIRWIDAVRAAGADVVFWDEPHWLLYETGLFDMDPSVWGCRCARCKDLYRERYDAEMPHEETDEVVGFKHDSAARLLFRLSAYAKSLGLRVAVCLLPMLRSERDWQHWHEIASHPDIDIFATDPYTMLGETGLDDYYSLGAEKFVSFYAGKVKELCAQYGKEGQIWIQNFMIPRGREEEVAVAVRAAYGAGIRNIFAWGFEGSANMGFLRCDEPQAAWASYTAAVREAARQDEGDADTTRPDRGESA